MTACPKTVPGPKLPEGMSLEAMRAHPSWGYWVDGRPGGGCTLEAGHEGTHRCGLVTWWDPPVVMLESELAR